MFGQNSYENYKPATPVTNHLIIINALLLLTMWVFERQGIDLNRWLGMHYWEASDFQPYQMITYMFMHAGFTHLFFNMFTLFFFGRMLEMTWGSSRYIVYYLVTGVGAAIIQQLAWRWQIADIITDINLQHPEANITYGEFILNYPYLNNFITVGASGAVFGILLAFGMMFPNARLMLLFPPIPIKAKWMVLLYGVFELIGGVAGTTGDNVAHFAHLGGMLFGFILILFWRHKRNINF